MPIEFSVPVEVAQQTKLAQMAAEQVMRRLSRYFDEHEHERPIEYIQFIWPFMQQIERSYLPRPAKNGDSQPKAEDKPKKATTNNVRMIHMIEALSWGDAGIYLCTPSSALGGAAINAVGTPEQKERFLRRFTEGAPKWGAMAMTEPHAGSDTSNIRTTARLDEATHEWVLNGEKIYCTSGALATQESNGLVVVWATAERTAGRATMKPFVVEAGTPGMTVANHTMIHPMLTRIAAARAAAEITDNTKLIQKTTGVKPRYFRPPYGLHNNRTDAVAKKLGQAVVLWSAGALDWQYDTPAKIVEVTLPQITPGAIVLAHDIHPWTIKAVPSLIAKLRAKGYTLVSLDDILRNPRAGNTYSRGLH